MTFVRVQSGGLSVTGGNSQIPLNVLGKKKSPEVGWRGGNTLAEKFRQTVFDQVPKSVDLGQAPIVCLC